MLTAISLHNFKSFQDARLPLASVTFLIGANASGKSNALEGVRLLNWLAKGSSLDDIEREIQGGGAVVRGLAKDLFGCVEEKFLLGCEIVSGENGLLNLNLGIAQEDEKLYVAAESVKKDEGNRSIYESIEKHVRGQPYLELVYIPELKISLNDEKAAFCQLDGMYFDKFAPFSLDEQDFIAIEEIAETLKKITFIDTHPATMRGYAYIGDKEIKENGSNLSAVLYRICQQGEAAKQSLLDFIRCLPEQDITDIQFIVTERRDVMLRLEESFGAKKRLIDAPLLSDGTLRVLAIAATLLTVEEGSLIVVEEIDNGVHPSRADVLVQQISKIAEQRHLRLLLTSHNPALLDALPDQALADVLCCYRDLKQGDSRITRLGDMDRYPELLAQGPLGQLMTRRVLERFLKDSTTPEERKQAAQDWLAQFQQAGQELAAEGDA